MIPKQDRQGVRQAKEIEQKYDLNKDYSAIEKTAAEAKLTADSAKRVADAAKETADKATTGLESLGKTVSKNAEDISDLTERTETLEKSGGVAGATFTPSVDADGNLSWTNDKGLENPATVNIKGQKGDTGSPGANGSPGADATINGVNSLTIEAGDNIELEQTDGVLTISSTGGSGGNSAIESADYPGCFYRMVNGVQEWLNPPMEMGVEYKTTERHLGKPVYMQALDFGNLPNNTAKYTDTFLPLDVLDCVVDMTPYHTITSVYFSSDTYIRHMGYRYLTSTTRQLEFNYTFSETHLAGRVTSNYDASAQKGYMVFKYTKTTD